MPEPPAPALIVDNKALGSMVDENLSGTAVSTDGVGIQAKSIRDKNDKWRLRCRRVTVPIVQEPPPRGRSPGWRQRHDLPRHRSVGAGRR